MKRILSLISAGILLSSISLLAQTQKLRCEYLENPLGIDQIAPRFTWEFTTKQNPVSVKICVDTDSLALVKGRNNIWTSSQITSSQQLAIYTGKPLQSFQKYYWKLVDKNNQTLSAIASFEMGLLNPSDWKGAWISDSQGKEEKNAPYFRKAFEAKKEIVSARAYIAVGGLYELSINGQRVGNHRLDPMYTRFDRRTLYATYDVTKHLQHGKNAIGVLLGNGWYNHQSTAVWFFDKAPWRNRPTFCLDVRITYKDGSVETISSGKGWKTSESPVTFNSIYTAEHYDARLEKTGWNLPNYDEKTWKDVIYRAAPSTRIVSQALHPIGHTNEILSKTLKTFSKQNYVFDLGENISGVSTITVKGNAGTVIRLKHGERLLPDGHVDQSNIDVHYRPTDDKDPFQTDIFILGGKGEETFTPKFNYKGFQYIEINSSEPIELMQNSVKGYFMHSDVPAIGKITSSNPTLNKIWAATNRSYLSNLFGYPTDCPQREKNGWTGDAHIASETGLYNFDGITIYEKWLADHRDEQQPNGVLPSIIPTGGWGYEWGNGPDWTSTIAIIPWNIYLFYGDSKLLKDSYEPIKRYVDHITDISPNGLCTWGLGDWVPVKSKTPVELTSTAYYFVDVTILAKAAKLLGNQEDYAKYSALAEKIKKAFNQKYLNEQTGIYGAGVQTELSVPLYWGLVPEALKSKVAKNLADRVAQDNYHLDVGLLGTKAILNALSENGYASVAYKVASQESYPSWGWWIVNGATSLYENWPIDAKSDISMNHIMFGEIGAWLYKGLAGIFPDEQGAGFKSIILKPNFVEGLATFSADFESPRGLIHSEWEQKGNTVIYKIVVPPNASAKVQLPEGYKVKSINQKAISTPQVGLLSAGEYTLLIEK